MRGQLHAPAALFPEGRPPLANEQEFGLFPEPVRTLWRRKTSLAPVWNRKPLYLGRPVFCTIQTALSELVAEGTRAFDNHCRSFQFSNKWQHSRWYMATKFLEEPAVSFLKIVLSPWITLIVYAASSSETPEVFTSRHGVVSHETSVFISTGVTKSSFQYITLNLLRHAYDRLRSLIALPSPRPIKGNTRHFLQLRHSCFENFSRLYVPKVTHRFCSPYAVITPVTSCWNTRNKYVTKSNCILNIQEDYYSYLIRVSRSKYAIHSRTYQRVSKNSTVFLFFPIMHASKMQV
jgi:hypothetical protein